MNTEEIAEMLYPLTVKQLTGLGSLAFLAIREETTLEHQWQESGFTDLPYEVIEVIDVTRIGLIELATVIATQLLEDFATHAASK